MTKEQYEHGLDEQFRNVELPISWIKRDDGGWMGLIKCNGLYIDIPVDIVKTANNHVTSCYMNRLQIRPSGTGRTRLVDVINAIIHETER